MPVSRVTLKRIADVRLRVHEIMVTLENRAAIDIAQIADRLFRDVARMLGEGQLVGHELEVIGQVDSMLRVAAQMDAAILSGHFELIVQMGLGTARTAMLELGMLNDRRALIATQRFNAEFLPELRTQSYQGWLERLPETALRPVSVLRKTLTEGLLTGKSINRTAEDFIRRGGLYDLPETVREIDPIVRARAVVRTEFARIDNDSSILFSASAGVEKFVNLGVGDSRQSDICAFATKQKPLTIAQWRALSFEGEVVGMAPRHVANCRCLMIGAPPDYADIVDAQLEAAGVLR